MSDILLIDDSLNVTIESIADALEKQDYEKVKTLSNYLIKYSNVDEFNNSVGKYFLLIRSYQLGYFKNVKELYKQLSKTKLLKETKQLQDELDNIMKHVSTSTSSKTEEDTNEIYKLKVSDIEFANRNDFLDFYVYAYKMENVITTEIINEIVKYTSFIKDSLINDIKDELLVNMYFDFFPNSNIVFYEIFTLEDILHLIDKLENEQLSLFKLACSLNLKYYQMDEKYVDKIGLDKNMHLKLKKSMSMIAKQTINKIDHQLVNRTQVSQIYALQFKTNINLSPEMVSLVYLHYLYSNELHIDEESNLQELCKKLNIEVADVLDIYEQFLRFKETNTVNV